MKELTVSWFSAGVSSAVATKLAIDSIDKIIYIHIDDQHPDSLRFVKECETWFGKPVEIIQSSKFKTVEAACLGSGGRGYVNGANGAACTKSLKKKVRRDWEIARKNTYLSYVWGMDLRERERSEDLKNTMLAQTHIFPLIEKGMSKEDAHKILKASGIKRPAMYDLGYSNNNCIGCVKGGMGYWNHIRRDFPEVFEARSRMERAIRATCIKGVYLDELDPERGRHEKPIVEDCGILCETMNIS